MEQDMNEHMDKDMTASGPRGAAPAARAGTRERLIGAGVRLFGLHGFEATSTRALATEAGANLGAIPYHFGGKEGLYHAVAGHIVDVMLAQVGPSMAGALAVCQDPAARREDVLAALRTTVRGMVRIMLATPEARSFSQIVLQEQIAPTSAFPIFYERFLKRVHGMWCVLLARLTGLDPASTELTLRAFATMGQLVIFRMAMASALRRLDCDRLDDAHLECIARIVCDQVEAMTESCSPVCTEATS
jgi:AcrR family transcriptional regulator